jgi:hypothetical protein
MERNILQIVLIQRDYCALFNHVKTKNPKGFVQNKIVAKQGGKIAGDARKALELKTGVKVVSEENYLPEAMKNRELK